MKPTEMSLFDAKEQTLLVSTEADRLAALDEDELGDLLVRVRRARDKYSGLHRRQASESVRGAGKRFAATSSNTRTLRKAEILEDALSRVSLALSRAARATANGLKRQRIAAARGERARAGEPGAGRADIEDQRRRAAGKAASARRRADVAGGEVTARRVASTRASNARRRRCQIASAWAATRSTHRSHSSGG